MNRLTTARSAAAAALLTAMLILALITPAVAPAASDNTDSSFPLPDGTQLEVHTTANCVSAERQCYFTASANRRAGDRVEGFPAGLWARQTTTIRSSDRLNWLETQVVADNTRVYKAGGKREITTIYFGGGPPEKYRVTGTTQPTDFTTGQPMLDADYIVCAWIQVVYPGVNITSPETCAQTTF
jgi:hypothetical protein